MGIAATWASIQGLSREQVLERLGTTETGELQDRRYGVGYNAMAISTLPSGRIVLVSGGGLVSRELARVLSVGAEVVAAMMEEHVMVSGAWGFRDGQMLWAIEYDDENIDGQIVVSGDPPSIFTDLHGAALRLQAEDDDDIPVDHLFDLAPDVAAEVGGYHPLRSIPGWTGDLMFLEDPKKASRLAVKAARAEARKASGGLAGAVKRLFGGP